MKRTPSWDRVDEEKTLVTKSRWRESPSDRGVMNKNILVTGSTKRKPSWQRADEEKTLVTEGWWRENIVTERRWRKKHRHRASMKKKTSSQSRFSSGETDECIQMSTAGCCGKVQVIWFLKPFPAPFAFQRWVSFKRSCGVTRWWKVRTEWTVISES